MTDPWEAQREALGAFIREQRKRANLSLRQDGWIDRLNRFNRFLRSSNVLFERQCREIDHYRIKASFSRFHSSRQ